MVNIVTICGIHAALNAVATGTKTAAILYACAEKAVVTFLFWVTAFGSLAVSAEQEWQL